MNNKPEAVAPSCDIQILIQIVGCKCKVPCTLLHIIDGRALPVAITGLTD